MTSTYTDDQVNLMKEVQEEANKLLKDKKAFNAKFDEIFAKFDKNKDGNIGLAEYVQFFNSLLVSAKKKTADLSVVMLNFDRADKNKDGEISKEEFKKEVIKRLNEFIVRKV